MKINYVAGFARTPSGTVFGCRDDGDTFIDGEVEEDEDALDAMTRNFYEFTGVCTQRRQWRHIFDIYGVGFRTSCFLADLPADVPCPKMDPPVYAVRESPNESMNMTARWIYWAMMDSDMHGSNLVRIISWPKEEGKDA